MGRKQRTIISRLASLSQTNHFTVFRKDTAFAICRPNYPHGPNPFKPPGRQLLRLPLDPLAVLAADFRAPVFKASSEPLRGVWGRAWRKRGLSSPPLWAGSHGGLRLQGQQEGVLQDANAFQAFACITFAIASLVKIKSNSC